MVILNPKGQIAASEIHLRLNLSEKRRWNLMPFIFTIVVVSILVGVHGLC